MLFRGRLLFVVLQGPLQEYEKHTNIMLDVHSLVEQLNCDSGRIPYRLFYDKQGPLSTAADLGASLSTCMIHQDANPL